MKKILLLMLLTNPLFAICQTTSSKDTICYKLNDAKTLLKFAERGYLCDSLIIAYDSTITIQEEIILRKDQQLTTIEQLVNAQRYELQRLERNQKLWKIVAIGLSSALLFETILLLVK